MTLRILIGLALLLGGIYIGMHLTRVIYSMDNGNYTMVWIDSTDGKSMTTVGDYRSKEACEQAGVATLDELLKERVVTLYCIRAH